MSILSVCVYWSSMCMRIPYRDLHTSSFSSLHSQLSVSLSWRKKHHINWIYSFLLLLLRVNTNRHNLSRTHGAISAISSNFIVTIICVLHAKYWKLHAYELHSTASSRSWSLGINYIGNIQTTTTTYIYKTRTLRTLTSCLSFVLNCALWCQINVQRLIATANKSE